MKNRILAVAVLAAVCCRAEVQTEMSAAGSPRPLAPEFLGYNGNFCRAGSWNDPTLLNTFRKMSPGHLRYPAGTIANYWDWKTGWFKDGTHPPHGLAQVAENPYTLADLKKGCGEDVMPVFVLNLLTSDLEYQLEMLREAKRIGLPVKRIELGNEYYLEKPDYMERFPAAEDYANEANRWAAAITGEFPEAKICAIGAAVRASDGPRRTTWNGIVFPMLGKNIDAVALHIYAGSGMFINKNELYEATGLVKAAGAQAQKSGIWGDAAQQIAQFKRFNGPDGVIDMLSMPARRWEGMNDLVALPNGFEVWVTEYNLFDRVGPVRGTWTHGLFAGAMTLSFLQDDRVQMATYHSLYGNSMFCAIYENGEAFDGLVKAPTVKEYPHPAPTSLSAGGVALSIIGQAITGMTAVQPLTFSENPSIVSPAYGPYLALSGWLFSDGISRKAVVLNLSGDAISVQSGLMFSSMTQFAADPRSVICEAGDLPAAVAVTEKMELPSWSVSVFE